MEKSKLPEGVTTVLRVAAEGKVLAGELAASVGSSADELYQACLFYLQTVVFHPHASDAYLLALPEVFEPQALREHKRLILKWLHPDRNHNNWENRLFLRVHAAILRLEKKMQVTGETEFPALRKQKVPSQYLLRKLDGQSKKAPRTWHEGLLRHSGLIKVLLAITVVTIGLVSFYAITTEGHGLQMFFEASN
ncbi:MAG: hypothetical protein KGO94_03715 [Alphaproteobacteria bacterium]|nr:hypothetical protein [Alphaproteobacteria bacterium]